MSALHGLRVIELAAEPIAFAGKLLADMGADVILVEPPGATRAATFPRSWTMSRERTGACTSAPSN
ncbi:MAG: CoA transferase [Gammaproteobacteria bacterium]|nr:CoA transferase [Gammaproteobacteria bacterium]MDE0364310.1 CoA transferase [Gammaproteobacteria bacterium]